MLKGEDEEDYFTRYFIKYFLIGLSIALTFEYILVVIVLNHNIMYFYQIASCFTIMVIIGFILMLMTEILYSWRKRSRSARWGKMSNWLRFHIFTGLVGPYMVLLHTSWKFNGLAGIVLLLTVIIVLSGIVGRYIFTAIPRTADGNGVFSLLFVLCSGWRRVVELPEDIKPFYSLLIAWE